MSKPLTEQQRRILDKCVPDDQNLSLAIVAVLDRVDFLEDRLEYFERSKVLQEKVWSDLARCIGSLIAAGYNKIPE